MTDQELLKRFYDDIKQSSDPSWFDNLFKFPKHQATYRQFFEVLPEPLRGYALEECESELTITNNLADVFDQGFTWSEATHGKAWNRLYRAIDGRLHGRDTNMPTVDYLLETIDD